MDKDFEKKWNELQTKLENQFGGDMDIQAILFLIGVQELGRGKQKFSKDQKLELMHVAICTVLAPFGYYKLTFQDEEGWPHFEALKPLPFLKPGEQLRLMKQGILEYFGEDY